MRAIRPFVKFNYDLRKKLSPQQKSKITRYFNYLSESRNDNSEIYRPRNPRNLQIAKEYANVKGSEWKAIPLKKSIDGAAVGIKNGKITFDAGPLGYSRIYLLDQLLLATDGADAACTDAGVPKTIKKNQRYMILTGGNDFNGTFKKYHQLIQNDFSMGIDDMVMKYGADVNWRIDVQVISYQNASEEARNRYSAMTKREQRTRQERKRKR